MTTPTTKVLGAESDGLIQAETWQHVTAFFSAGERSGLGVTLHRRESALEACKWISTDFYVFFPC